jgi:chemotaxis protein methyltransferase CheR
MTEPELDYLRAFLKARSGLALGPEKRYLVDSRLGPLCKRNALRDLSELVSRLKLGCDRALERSVVDAMTTNGLSSSATAFPSTFSGMFCCRAALTPRAGRARSASGAPRRRAGRSPIRSP